MKNELRYSEVQALEEEVLWLAEVVLLELLLDGHVGLLLQVGILEDFLLDVLGEVLLVGVTGWHQVGGGVNLDKADDLGALLSLLWGIGLVNWLWSLLDTDNGDSVLVSADDDALLTGVAASKDNADGVGSKQFSLRHRHKKWSGFLAAQVCVFHELPILVLESRQRLSKTYLHFDGDQELASMKNKSLERRSCSVATGYMPSIYRKIARKVAEEAEKQTNKAKKQMYVDVNKMSLIQTYRFRQTNVARLYHLEVEQLRRQCEQAKHAAANDTSVSAQQKPTSVSPRSVHGKTNNRHC